MDINDNNNELLTVDCDGPAASVSVVERRSEARRRLWKGARKGAYL